MLDLIRKYILNLKLDNERLGHFAEVDPRYSRAGSYAGFLFEECFKALFPRSAASNPPGPANCDARIFDGEVYFWVEGAKPGLIPEIESMLLACFEGFYIRKIYREPEGDEAFSGIPRTCWQLERTET